MNKLFYIGILAALCSCTNGIDLKNIDYTPMLNDSNSKVWIIEQIIVEGADMAPTNDLAKDIIVFHDNKMVNMVPMQQIGTKTPRRGTYHVDSQNNNLLINFEDGTWDMEISYITEDSIFLVPNKNSKEKFQLQLKPFPLI